MIQSTHHASHVRRYLGRLAQSQGLHYRVASVSFLVRKMFTLGRPKRDQFENPDLDDTSLVLHDGRPVAIKEHLYELLCYCHLLAKYGGRDKPCAVIRSQVSMLHTSSVLACSI